MVTPADEAHVEKLNRLIQRGKDMLDETEALAPQDTDVYADDDEDVETEIAGYEIDADRFEQWQADCVELLEQIGAHQPVIDQFQDAEAFEDTLSDLVEHLVEIRDACERRASS